MVGLEALVVAPALPAGERGVERGGAVEHRRRGLAEQPAVAQRVADALRGDRVLEVAGVAGQRPARAGRAAEVGGRCRWPSGPSSTRSQPSQPLAQAGHRRDRALVVARRGRRGTRGAALDRRHQQHEHQPVVAGERRAQLARPRATGRRSSRQSGRGSSSRRSSRRGRWGSSGAGGRRPTARATVRAPAVGADDQRRAQLALAPSPSLSARPRRGRAVPDQPGHRGALADLGAGRARGLDQRRVEARPAHAQRVVDARRPACSGRAPSIPAAGHQRLGHPRRARAPRRAPAPRAAPAPRRRRRTAGGWRACRRGSARGRARRPAARRGPGRSPAADPAQPGADDDGVDVSSAPLTGRSSAFGWPGGTARGPPRLARLELGRVVELVHRRAARPSSPEASSSAFTAARPDSLAPSIVARSMSVCT